MKTTIKNLLPVTILILIISSCAKKAAVPIPEDASMVLHINAASLSSKLSWDEIKKSEWFSMMSRDSKPGEFEKKLLDNPESSGIDLKSDMYLFMKTSGNNAYMVFQGKIRDVAAYEAAVKQISDGKEIKKEGGFSYVGEGGNYLTWTADRFIVVGRSDMQMGIRRYGGGSVITRDTLLKYVKFLYNLKTNKSIGSDSRFASLLSEPGEMHFWVNSSDFTRNSMPGELSMLKAASLVEDIVTAATINFDNGKITATAKSYYNKELEGLYKKYKAGNLNTDMLKRIPGQNISAVFAMNYPPEGVKEFLKLLGVDGLVNGFLGEAGYSIDEFVKANKGDLMIAVSDFTVKEKEMPLDSGGDKPNVHKTTVPDAKILFATSINDKAAFDKLIGILSSKIKEEAVTDKLPDIKYEVKDNWFIAGNAADQVSSFSAGTATDHPFISKISGHPMGGYINLQKIISGIDRKGMGMMEKMITGDGANIWDDIVFYGGEMKGDASVSYFEINLVDKNSNSLKQLNSYMSSMAKKAKEYESTAEERLKNMNDSTTVKPPPARVKKPG
jgi:hypothetical protein